MWRGIRTVLYRYNQLWHGIFEPPTKKMRKSDEERLKTREVARAKAYPRPACAIARSSCPAQILI